MVCYNRISRTKAPQIWGTHDYPPLPHENWFPHLDNYFKGPAHVAWRSLNSAKLSVTYSSPVLPKKISSENGWGRQEKQGANIPHAQTRCRSQRSYCRYHQKIRTEGIQTGRHEIYAGTISATFEPLNGFRKWYINSCSVSLKVSKELLEQHYEELKDKKFFPGLVNYMSSGPVVPMVWKFFF